MFIWMLIKSHSLLYFYFYFLFLVVDEVIGFADIHIHEPEGDVLIFMTGQVSIFMIRHLLYNKM